MCIERVVLQEVHHQHIPSDPACALSRSHFLLYVTLHTALLMLTGFSPGIPGTGPNITGPTTPAETFVAVSTDDLLHVAVFCILFCR